MGECLLCPPGDRHVPDTGLPDHVRVLHPAAWEPPDCWPDGGYVIEDHDPEPSDAGGGT